ncbi:U4/U6.U5 small nuclear ribonucleoprotein 27 kDa protein-like [Phymastichus coffea]|uniref:U4/U6.U5 small nuclear ribonucleoprotein 27 kDa protein-like n=1 Tax=Phymastichus coffea TaxID=108790 RepID=UPI00273C86E9|nr:U4/U6.U5 small nuclear ribonucleoprotein 27 kDa protein-like [Phymastichus coffea]XP_058794018.1 U4/U6.U5 small nuclear ribonucleoprotein 27 kDa protein-like [Phymastichus coffea]XP_058794019.1 U4/U6.U5 small nuclear ribonucleoprotein 27 kDa protein-like [Phymastichus coffea]XP_058794020.1 U4/U6.U5 small nuclear ribonucleoprotein 27 kDa protein-like [Phymastichus coffea]
MGRSRTPSPNRRRDRSRERDRDRRRRRSRERRRRSIERERVKSRDRERDIERHRDYDRDRERHRRSYSRSRSRERERPINRPRVKHAERPIITEADLQGKTPEEQQMMRMMGFCGFDTTKGKKVEGNDVGAVHVILKRKYRQYMNRKGGFNRPLDFVA